MRHLFVGIIFEPGSKHYYSPFTPSRKKIHGKKPFKNSVVLKHFLLLGSNNSDSVVFGYVSFGEIEDHSLRATPSKNFFLV